MEKFSGFLDKIVNVFWNPEEDRPRALVRLIIFTIVLLLVMFVITMVVSMLFYPSSDTTSTTTETLSTGTFIFLQILYIICYLVAPTLITLWFMGKYIDKRPIKDFGFHINRKWWLDLCIGLGLGVVIIVIIFFLERTFNLVSFDPNPVSQIAPIPFVVGVIVEIIYSITLCFSIEAMARGYIQKNFAEAFSSVKLDARLLVAIVIVFASIASGLLNTILYQVVDPTSWVNIFMVFILGFVLGYAYFVTGNIALPLGFHITWMLFQGVVFGFPINGIGSVVSFAASNPLEPYFLSGGLYGPEAGLIIILPLLLAAACIFLYGKYIQKTLPAFQDIAHYDPRVDIKDEKKGRSSPDKKSDTKQKK